MNMYDATETAFKNGYEAGVEDTVKTIREEITRILEANIATRNHLQDTYINSNGVLESIGNLDGRIASLVELDYFITSLSGEEN